MWIIPIIQVVLFYSLFFGGIGAALGKPKGLTIDGIVYGILLGPFGWLVVLLKQATPESQAKRDSEVERERQKVSRRVHVR